MSFEQIGLYLVDKICSYLSVRDVASLEQSCTRLHSEIDDVGVWRKMLEGYLNKFQYVFVIDALNSNSAEHFVSSRRHKLLMAIVVVTNRAFKKYFQCCYWEEKHVDEQSIGPAVVSDGIVVDAEEIAAKELLFTRGDKILFKNDHLLIEDPDFPGLMLDFPLFNPPNISIFLRRYNSWLERYLDYMDKLFDVLREAVFLLH